MLGLLRWLSNPLFDDFQNIPARIGVRERDEQRDNLKKLHNRARIGVFCPLGSQ